jgi:hypothetical protein
MGKLWILRGDLDAPGWNVLRKDYEDEEVDIIHLDPKVWAIIEGDQAPTGYEGLEAHEPADGMYVDPNGSPLYVVDGAIVPDANAVVTTLGDEATALFEQIGDAVAVLERLGRVF